MYTLDDHDEIYLNCQLKIYLLTFIHQLNIKRNRHQIKRYD